MLLCRTGEAVQGYLLLIYNSLWNAFSCPFQPGNDSGCTAVVGLLRARTLYVANAGDSRCVVCRDGQAVEMSFDHKPGMSSTPWGDREARVLQFFGKTKTSFNKHTIKACASHS